MTMVQENREWIIARQDALRARAMRELATELADLAVVVTGGARGLGQAMGAGLLSAGARVAAADKSWDGAEDWQKELESSGRGIALTMDVTDEEEVEAAFARTLENFGRVDVLVNNAGLVSETLFAPEGHVKALDTTDRDWEIMFGVNVLGTMKVIRRFVAPMLERRAGSIVNVVSSGVLSMSLGGAYFGARPWTVEMPYQATKAALTTLTFYLAEELRHERVAVNAFMPGHTRASWFDATARAFQRGGGVYAMRPLCADHVLPLVYFLCSQAVAVGEPVSGRLYHVPDWNLDHGYGDVRIWGDYSLPPDIDARYAALEAAMPDFWRVGLARAPFDVERVVWKTTMDRIRSQLAEEAVEPAGA
jgi:NAD(P)-dependent dehydrogenase (short-subunit alcohol dehydrogenase family)